MLRDGWSQMICLQLCNQVHGLQHAFKRPLPLALGAVCCASAPACDLSAIPVRCVQSRFDVLQQPVWCVTCQHAFQLLAVPNRALL
jgi:hypothetical protein